MADLAQVVYNNNNKIIKEVDFLNIFPSRKYDGYNMVVTFFRDEKNHPYILFCDKVDKYCNFEIKTTVEESIYSYCNSKETILHTKVIPDEEKVMFRLIDLDNYPVKMTKESIEEKLGYRIEII